VEIRGTRFKALLGKTFKNFEKSFFSEKGKKTRAWPSK
jgi:hypothetical protein